MNVSISQLVKDFDTERHDHPGCDHLLLAGDGGADDHRRQARRPLGRRRAFAIGMVIYACGSRADRGRRGTWRRSRSAGRCSKASAPRSSCPRSSRWSPGNFDGENRAVAYGLVGGMAGVGVAVGPAPRRLGHHLPLVAAGVHRRGRRRRGDPAAWSAWWRTRRARAPPPQLDIVGAVLSASGSASSCWASCSRARGVGSSPATRRSSRLRVLAHAVRHRRRLRGDHGVRLVATSPRGVRTRPARTAGTVQERGAARRA